MNITKNSLASLRRLARGTRGANMVEYIILVGLVALICIGGYQAFGKKVNTAINDQSTTVSKVNTAAGTQ